MAGKFKISFTINGILLKVILLQVLWVASSCSPKIQKFFLKGYKIIRGDSSYVSANSDPNPCRQFMNYVPDENQAGYTPMRNVRVNFHIVSNAAGTNNFSPEMGIDYARKMVERTNAIISNNQKMRLPEGNNTPALHPKYQFVLSKNPDDPDDSTGVYFHYDEEDGYFVKHGPNKNVFDQSLFEKYQVQKGNVLNIFLLEHHTDSIPSPTYKASVDGVGFNDWIKAVGIYQYLYDTVRHEDGSISLNMQMANICHESGHTLGLAHTWNANDGCDDTPMNPGCWDQFSGPCKESGIFSNNMMDYNNCQCALTPCQLAKIHSNFSRENSSQRKLLQPLWCDYKPDASIVIGILEDVVWNSSKDLEGDIIINSGGKLTIRCEVSLPKGAKVIVKPKGTLILDGGSLLNKCGDNWEGIEIWRSKRNEGSVIVVNNAVIENVVNGPLTINH